MNICEKSQADVARYIGVSQQAVSRLLVGGVQGSKHLHRIARFLKTTPAYLTGETDDPDNDAPDAPELTSEERELLECYRVLTPADRGALIHIARGLAGRGIDPKSFAAPTTATVQSPALEYHGEGSG